MGLALNRVKATYKDRAVPLMGVCAAFIFAAQMINFPIPGGTSGHLLGGTLAGVLLGPWVGALFCAVELALSGTAPLTVAVTAMLVWHLLIGLGEALITLLAISYIWRSRPNLIFDPPAPSRHWLFRPLQGG